ncbi:MAG: 16S rRNA (uracil(1498)-N(3))-methyltransferase, partial [Bacteroidales bacterium]|nr:16S rRNA (uracil(1498)-N(3))-methyltransferase [Bacteroidales bacterium]
GDFSPEEIAQSLSMQFVPVTLGDLRLRTETAAVVACHSLVLLNAMAAEGLWR